MTITTVDLNLGGYTSFLNKNICIGKLTISCQSHLEMTISCNKKRRTQINLFLIFKISKYIKKPKRNYN